MKRIVLFLLAFSLLLPFASHAELQMYIPMGETNDLVIINLDTDTVVGRISELENAHGLATSSGSEYLVAGSMQPVGREATKKAVKPQAISDAEHKDHHAGGAEKTQAASPSYVSVVHPKHGHVMRRVEVRGLLITLQYHLTGRSPLLFILAPVVYL